MSDSDDSSVFRVDGFVRRTTMTNTSTRRLLRLAEIDGDPARQRVLNVYGTERASTIGGAAFSKEELYVTLPLERFFGLAEDVKKARASGRTLELIVARDREGSILELKIKGST